MTSRKNGSSTISVDVNEQRIHVEFDVIAPISVDAQLPPEAKQAIENLLIDRWFVLLQHIKEFKLNNDA